MEIDLNGQIYSREAIVGSPNGGLFPSGDQVSPELFSTALDISLFALEHFHSDNFSMETSLELGDINALTTEDESDMSMLFSFASTEVIETTLETTKFSESNEDYLQGLASQNEGAFIEEISEKVISIAESDRNKAESEIVKHFHLFVIQKSIDSKQELGGKYRELTLLR